MTRQSRSPAGKSFIWGALDQGLNSLSNLGITILIARSTGPQEFGSFILAFTVYLLAIQLARAVTSNVYLLVSDMEHSSEGETGTAVLRASFELGMIFSAAGLLIALVVPSTMSKYLVVLSVVMPFLLAQDAWRYLQVADGTVHRAAVSDMTWIVIQAALTLAVVAGGATGGVLLLSSWCAGGIVSAAPAIAMVYGHAAWGRVLTAWLVRFRSTAVPLAVEYGAVAVSTQAVVYVVGFMATVAAAGSFKLGQLLFAPLMVAVAGVTPVAMVRTRRRVTEYGTRVARNDFLRYATVLTLIACLYVGGLLATPDSWGRVLLGLDWESVEPLIGPLGAWVLATMLLTAATVGLRALGQVYRSSMVRVLSAPVILVTVAIGATSGLVESAWGLAAGTAVGAVAAVLLLRRKSSNDPPHHAHG